MNKHVADTREQMLNTLQVLSKCGLARITKGVILTAAKDTETLTWDNHIPGRYNSGASFTTLNQYVSIYENGAYHCILFDGSIMRASFRFHRNLLLGENLLYWPAPIYIPEEDIDELGIREAVDLYFAEIDSTSKKIHMRSPFRFDFDSSNISEQHPAAHVHMQHPECRISARRPICFNTFVKFIFKNFYPDVCPSILDNLEPLYYSGFDTFDKAVICL